MRGGRTRTLLWLLFGLLFLTPCDGDAEQVNDITTFLASMLPPMAPLATAQEVIAPESGDKQGDDAGGDNDCDKIRDLALVNLCMRDVVKDFQQRAEAEQNK